MRSEAAGTEIDGAVPAVEGPRINVEGRRREGDSLERGEHGEGRRYTLRGHEARSEGELLHRAHARILVVAGVVQFFGGLVRKAATEVMHALLGLAAERRLPPATIPSEPSTPCVAEADGLAVER